MLKPFFIRHEKLLKRIDPQKVVGLYTEGNYTKILLSNFKYYEVRSSLSRALKKLPPEMFVRIDRTMVVSIYFIDDIARDHLVISDETLDMEKKPFNIGRQYYKSLIDKLDIIE
jgi:DNA-binding LytR/AlgR family response regulator